MRSRRVHGGLPGVDAPTILRRNIISSSRRSEVCIRPPFAGLNRARVYRAHCLASLRQRRRSVDLCHKENQCGVHHDA